jgi:hypothetical protein
VRGGGLAVGFMAGAAGVVVTVAASTFANNSGRLGGGATVYLGAYVDVANATVGVTDSGFYGNVGQDGGGLHLANFATTSARCTTTVTGCTFVGNLAVTGV